MSVPLVITAVENEEKQRAKEESRNLPEHIVAVDGSEHSERAFEWACDQLPKDHTLVLVHGVHKPEFRVEAMPDSEGKWMEKQRRKAFEDYEFMQSARTMHRYARLCRQHERKCEWMTVPYRSATELSDNICSAAHRRGISNIVCGSRGLGTLERALLGSTSSGLVHNCPANVTVVRD